MFISWQTHEGLQITAHSVVEATKFLLNIGMQYVLTERFCQDSVEEYFGNQRKFGRRSDNPDIKTLGTIIILSECNVQSPANLATHEGDDDPVPKKKSKK